MSDNRGGFSAGINRLIGNKNVWKKEYTFFAFFYSAIVSVLTAIHVYKIDLVDKYSDFVSGVLTTKNQAYVSDILFFITLGVVFVLAFFLLMWLCPAIEKKTGLKLKKLYFPLLLLHIPLLFNLLPLIYSNSGDLIKTQLDKGLELLLPAAVFILGIMITRERFSRRKVNYLAILFFLLNLFVGYSVAGFILVLSQSALINHDSVQLLLNNLTMVANLLIFLFWLYQCNKLEKGIIRITRKLVLFGWAGVPLLILYLLPLPLIHAASGEFLEMGQNSSLPLQVICVISIVVLYLLWLLLILGKKISRNGFSIRIGRSASIWKVFLILPIVVFSCSAIQPVPTLTEDWFHNAQIFIPWQQLSSFEMMPFVDFFPQQGNSSIVFGFVNELLFGGSMGAFTFSIFLLNILLMLIAVRFTFRGWGFIPALILVFVPVLTFKAMPLLAAFAILGNKKLLNRPVNWVIAWLIMLPAVFLFIPMTGIAYLLSGLVVAIRGFIISDLKGKLIISGVAIAMIIAVAVTPLFAVFGGYIQFILENSQTSVQALAIPLGDGALTYEGGQGVLNSTFVFNLLRFSCIGVMLLLFLVMIYEYFIKRTAESKKLGLYLLYAILVTLLFAYYGIYRLEASVASRIWYVSIFVAAFPLVAILHSKGWLKKLAVFASLVVFSVLLLNQPHPQKIIHSREAVAEKLSYRVIPHSHTFCFANDEFPTLKGLFTRREMATSIVKFRKLLQELGQDVYFDFTDTPLRYFVQNKKMPTFYSLCYNAVNAQQQLREIEELKKKKVKVVLAGPQFYPAYIPPSLRSYRTFDYIMDNYSPYLADEFLFFLKDKELNKNKMKSFKPATREDLEKHFEIKDFSYAAVKWGRNYDNLLPRLKQLSEAEEISSVEDGKSTHTLIKLDLKAALQAGAADMLEITINEDAKFTQGDYKICWLADGAQSSYISLKLQPGRNLIPVGGAVSWKLAKEIRAMVVSPEEGSTREPLIIEACRLFALDEN